MNERILETEINFSPEVLKMYDEIQPTQNNDDEVVKVSGKSPYTTTVIVEDKKLDTLMEDRKKNLEDSKK